MRRIARSLVLSLASLVFLVASGTAALPLRIAHVDARALTCIYSTDCTVSIALRSSGSSVTLPGAVGSGRFVSASPQGMPGAPAQGLFGYEYRLDLEHLVALTAVPCVWKIQIHFGPVVPFDFDGDGVIDQVYVVTGDGLGNIAPATAEQTGNDISFTFDTPICAGTSDGRGDSSFYIGLLSTEDMRPVSAEVFDLFDTSPVAIPPIVLGPQIPGELPIRLFLPSAIRAGRHLILHASGARPGAKLALYAGAESGKAEIADCPGVTLAIAKPTLVAEAEASAKGRATFELTAPDSPSGSLVFQILERSDCEESRPETAKVE